MFASSRYITLLSNTFIIAVITATATMFIASLTAWLTVRKAPGSKILDQLATTPLVFPGIVLGVGVMQLFLRLPIGVYGTIWIIAIAHLTVYLSYASRATNAALTQLHPEMEEAARMAGAGPFATIRRITRCRRAAC